MTITLHTPPTSGVNAAPRDGVLNELKHRHQEWYVWTLAYLGLAAACLLAGLIDERTFQGASVWYKPFKFALSIAVYFATLGWFAPLLPGNYFRTREGVLLTRVPVACALFEMLYILIQGAQGEASHFNVSSPFYGAMYSLMGIGATLMVATCLWLGVRILRNPANDSLWSFAVGVGLIATFILGGGFGGYLGSAGSHWVGGLQTDSGGLPLVHWSRTGGDLRVAHFFGIHAMQILPLAGAACAALQHRGTLTSRTARVGFIAIAIAFAAFSVSTFLQAIRGVPVLG